MDHLIDPELRSLLSLLPSFELTPDTLKAVRAGAVAMAPSLDQIADSSVSIRSRQINRPAQRPVDVVVFEATGRKRGGPAILHLHGGGFVMGTVAMTGADLVDKAKRFNALVVSVDYQLAPETRFPGQIEEAYAVLCWLRREADALGLDPTRIVLMGESAGGGLAFSLALYARQHSRDTAPVRHLHLLYPVLDDRVRGREVCGPNVGFCVWSPDSNRFCWDALLGPEPDWAVVGPLLAGRVEDLSGLPSTFMAIGSIDLFAAENLRLAERLLTAGGSVELHLYPGGFHGFQMAEASRSGRDYRHASTSALERTLAS